MLAPLATAMNAYSAGAALRVGVGVEAGALKVQVRARTDVGGQQVSVGGIGPAELSVAEAWQEQRRLAQRLLACTAALEVFNDIYRLQRRKREGHYDAELSELCRLRDAMRKHLEEATVCEDAALLELYAAGDGRPGRLDHLREPLEAATRAFEQTLLDLFLRQFADASQVTLSVFSEDAETLIDLARSYWSAARAGGSAEVWQYLPASQVRTQAWFWLGSEAEKGWKLADAPPPGAVLARRQLPDPVATLDVEQGKWWSGVVGVGLAIQGKAAQARFGGEDGLHVFHHTTRATTRALVCSSAGAIGAHPLPEGIERRGAIGNQQRRRTYRLEQGTIDDPRREGTWAAPGRHLHECLPALLEELLWQAAREILTR
jgi:hypothetical protein